MPATLESGPVRMDVERHTVTDNGEHTSLPRKEVELLAIVQRDPDTVRTPIPRF